MSEKKERKRPVSGPLCLGRRAISSLDQTVCRRVQTCDNCKPTQQPSQLIPGKEALPCNFAVREWRRGVPKAATARFQWFGAQPGPPQQRRGFLCHIPCPTYFASCRCMLDARTRSSRRRAPCVCCSRSVGSVDAETDLYAACTE